MTKQEAITLLGGNVSATAVAVGVSYQAVDKWPDVLPQRIADRVQAALYRRQQSSAPDHTGPHTVGRPASLNPLEVGAVVKEGDRAAA